MMNNPVCINDLILRYNELNRKYTNSLDIGEMVAIKAEMNYLRKRITDIMNG